MCIATSIKKKIFISNIGKLPDIATKLPLDKDKMPSK